MEWRPLYRRAAARHGFAFLFAVVFVALLASPVLARPGAVMLIVSQPAKSADPHAFVDLAPWLKSELEESGSYQAIIYNRTLPAVKQALAAKTLAAADLLDPLTREAQRKIARVLGATYVLACSARSSKEGIAADVEVEMLTGQDGWSVVLVQHLDPYRSRDPKIKPSTLEGIHAQTAVIVQQITHMPVRVPVSPPVDVKTGKVVDTPSADGKPVPPPPGPSVEPRTQAPDAQTTAPAAPVQNAEPTTNDILVDRFRKQGDLPNLIIALRRAVNDRPRDARLREQLVRAYTERGWDAAAADEAARAAAVVPDSAALHRLLGDCSKALGQADQAIAEYQKAVALDGKDAANYVALGDGYWNAAKPDDALKAYADAARVDPKSALAHRKLARIYVEMGRFGESLSEMNAAQALTGDDQAAGLADDYAAVLGVAEADMTQILAKLQAGKQDLVSGRRNREQVFGDAGEQKKRADDLAVFMDSLKPPAALLRVQRLYAQAASLVAQAAEMTLRSLESEDTSRDEQATLLRIEAAKQLSAASQRLKTVRSAAPH